MQSFDENAWHLFTIVKSLLYVHEIKKYKLKIAEMSFASDRKRPRFFTIFFLTQLKENVSLDNFCDFTLLHFQFWKWFIKDDQGV